MITYAFIDASNLFYGGEKSLGWKIDYQKLYQYLLSEYAAGKLFYFGGVELCGFEYDYQKQDSVPLEKLKVHLLRLAEARQDPWIGRHLQRARFYMRLEQFGFILFLKPVKSYRQEDGRIERKANCDVDMAFRLMKERQNFNRALVLSGDGDFLPVLRHLRQSGKEVIVLSRAARTAKEIKQFAGSDFRDFEYLRERLRFA